MKIEIFRSEKSRGFFFRIRSNNHRIVAQSESYTRKYDATKTARKIMPRTRIVDLTK